LLAAVEEAGCEEEQGEHERELGVGLRVEVQLDESVTEPYDTSYEPDPGGFAHRFGLDGYDC
jgi:hypothetical protein